MKNTNYLLFTGCLLLLASSSVADIYKWVDQDGLLHFGDRAPTSVKSSKVSAKYSTASYKNHFFYATRPEHTEPVALSISDNGRLRLLERKTAYRNNKKACVRFKLPRIHNEPVPVKTMHIEAYNDDKSYLRAIWVEIDGVGGYIGVSRIGKGQYSGNGTIGAGETKKWSLPMDRFPLSLQGKQSTEQNFSSRLMTPGKHTICTWISTYEQYGPRSWVTLDLETSR